MERSDECHPRRASREGFSRPGCDRGPGYLACPRSSSSSRSRSNRLRREKPPTSLISRRFDDSSGVLHLRRWRVKGYQTPSQVGDRVEPTTCDSTRLGSRPSRGFSASGSAGKDAGQVGPLIRFRLPFQHVDAASQLDDACPRLRPVDKKWWHFRRALGFRSVRIFSRSLRRPRAVVTFPGSAKGGILFRSGRIAASIMLVVVASCGGDDGGGSTTTALPTTTEALVVDTASPTTSVPANTTTTLLDTTTEVVSDAPPGSVEVELAGSANEFRPNELTAPPGDTVFFLVNTGETGNEFAVHTLTIGLERGYAIARSDEVLPGTSASYTVRGLEPGEYVIWCSFRDHASLGMKGTLTVG